MVSSQVITDAETEILFTLAKKGKKTFKQLFEKEKIAKSNRTVHYSLKHLEFMELITSEVGENTGKGLVGRKATYYSLTSDGLLMVLYYLQKQDIDRFIDNIERIVRKQREVFPFIFGKWEFYRKNNLLEEVIFRLVVALKVEGAFLEEFVELRRNRMKMMLKQKDQFKESIEHMKHYLTGSELKNYPHHPVFMSKQEEEQQLRAFFKTMRETSKEAGDPSWREFGNLELNKILEAGKIIEEGTDKLSSRHLTIIFLFGSNRYSLNIEKQKAFLKILSQDADLKDFMKNYLEDLEKNRERAYKLVGV